MLRQELTGNYFAFLRATKILLKSITLWLFKAFDAISTCLNGQCFWSALRVVEDFSLLKKIVKFKQVLNEKAINRYK